MTQKDKNLPGKATRTDVADFLGKVARTPVPVSHGEKGRLLFAMDATASREPSWDMACQIQGEMFLQTQTTGNLSVQLAWYRGINEFHASHWHSNANDLLKTMSSVRCLGGMTQIARILNHAIDETRKKKINAIVFVGDAMEEDVDHLCQLAGQLGILGVPLFVFQENRDPVATMAFKQIAKLSNGAYCSFDGSSAQQLQDLLSAVAVFATGGHKALEDFSRMRGGATRLLSNEIKRD